MAEPTAPAEAPTEEWDLNLSSPLSAFLQARMVCDLRMHAELQTGKEKNDSALEQRRETSSAQVSLSLAMFGAVWSNSRSVCFSESVHIPKHTEDPDPQKR